MQGFPLTACCVAGPMAHTQHMHETHFGRRVPQGTWPHGWRTRVVRLCLAAKCTYDGKTNLGNLHILRRGGRGVSKILDTMGWFGTPAFFQSCFWVGF